jgi:hypothetical protein
MVKKVVMICFALTLVTVLACLTGGIQISAANHPSTSASKGCQIQAAGPFVGSRNSNVYHYPSCYHVQQIKQGNLVTFNTVADACAAGYRPCLDCNPPPCGSGLAVMLTPMLIAEPAAVA